MKVLLAIFLCFVFATSAFGQTGSNETKRIFSAAPLPRYTNSLGMEFVLIPAGSFMMGMGADVAESRPHERPRHKVTISKPFYLGTCEVTQAQWAAVMGNNPSYFVLDEFPPNTSWLTAAGGNDLSDYITPANPVENVSWFDAQEFITRLNAREGHARYRLPTEAEWEYAARAGTGTAYFFGDAPEELSTYAWCADNAGAITHPVGQKPANAWGLHDVHGNVYEWVQDWFGESYYAESPETDPKGPTSGPGRAFRGGSWFWFHNTATCRSGSRYYYTPDTRVDYVGFRLALSLE